MKIYLNEDSKQVTKIRTALKNNGGYCPCKIDKNNSTKCICEDFRNKTDSGFCHCGLYYKK